MATTSLGSDDQGIDFRRGGIAAVKDLDQLLQDLGDLWQQLGRQSRTPEKVDNPEGAHRLGGRQMHGHDFFRRGPRHFLNVDAAAGGEHQRGKPVLRIEGDAGIKFAGDLDFSG